MHTCQARLGAAWGWLLCNTTRASLDDLSPLLTVCVTSVGPICFFLLSSFAVSPMLPRQFAGMAPRRKLCLPIRDAACVIYLPERCRIQGDGCNGRIGEVAEKKGASKRGHAMRADWDLAWPGALHAVAWLSVRHVGLKREMDGSKGL